MARIRSDYDQSAWARFLRWIENGSSALDDDMTASQREPDAEDPPAPAAKADVLEREEALALLDAQEEEEEFTDSLHTWMHTRGEKLAKILYSIISVLLCCAIIFVLLKVTAALPTFGSAEDPMHNEVSRRYLEDGLRETGSVNLVGGMILDYRAFDTLGESHVLFTAACSVMILLRLFTGEGREHTARQLAMDAEDRQYEPKNDIILQRAATVLVPLILLYGIYVIMNGHLSPGGGFSGGAVMGAGLILFASAFGFARAERFFTLRTFRVFSVCALAFYAVSKTYSFFTGANHLDSFITPGTPGALFSAGLIPYLNLAVGLVVCCTMYAFYALFRKGDL